MAPPTPDEAWRAVVALRDCVRNYPASAREITAVADWLAGYDPTQPSTEDPGLRIDITNFAARLEREAEDSHYVTAARLLGIAAELRRLCR